MEEVVEYKIETELESPASYSDAYSAQESIVRLKKQSSVKLRKLKNPKIIETRTLFGEAADFEEYEAGHNLPLGTFKFIFEALEADIERNGPAAEIRRQKELFALPELYKLAQQILAKEVKVRNIGPKRAKYILDSAGVMLAPVPAE
jgi:hypothetical protein